MTRDNVSWQPHRESLSATLARTGAIALAVGAALALGRGGLSSWPFFTLLVLWFSFGGHWVEIFFLNWLRPRLSGVRSIQIGARIAVWFIGGVMLATGMILTARALTGYHPPLSAAWWIGGIAFIAIELAVHLALALRGRPNFYNGRG